MTNDLDERPSLEQRQLAFQYAVQNRQFEIGLFWQRSLYFWGMVAAALVAFGSVANEPRSDLKIPVICFGFLTSLAWSMQSRGSRYWHQAWERKVHRLEGEVLGMSVFERIEPLLPIRPKFHDQWLMARLFSVSKLAIAMSDISILLWIGLAVEASNFDTSEPIDWRTAGWLVTTLFIASCLVYFGRSSGPRPLSDE